MNAFTSDDMTAYFINVPANKLELWMWMESERLLRPVFREFYAERDVVFEERRMRTESTPREVRGGVQRDVLGCHPYSWPVVGWPSDIPAISKAQADEFYALYYAPQNITPILVGDFDPKEASRCRSVTSAASRAGRARRRRWCTLPPKWEAEKRMNAEAETNPQVDILWHTVPFGHKDSYAAAGSWRSLRTPHGPALQGARAGANASPRRRARRRAASCRRRSGPALFNDRAARRRRPHAEEVEQGIYDELDKLKKEPSRPRSCRR